MYLQVPTGATTGMTRYADCFDLGLLDIEKAMNGEHKENGKHTHDDILKQIHSSTTVLQTDINNYRNDILSAMYQVETFFIS